MDSLYLKMIHLPKNVSESVIAEMRFTAESLINWMQMNKKYGRKGMRQVLF